VARKDATFITLMAAWYLSRKFALPRAIFTPYSQKAPIPLYFS